MLLVQVSDLETDQQVQEEDATKLQFGEFADGEALTLTDVQALLLHARSVPGAPPPPDNKCVFHETRRKLRLVVLFLH
jgi:hypothetical protein